MTKPMSDEDLYCILRAADPLLGDSERPTAATEASLQRLLARGPGEVARPRRRGWLGRHLARWWESRLVPLAAAVAAVVGVISVLPSGGPVAVPTAAAKVIMARAAGAVAGSEGAILHADVSATQTWRNGHSDYWTEQDWQQVSPPYDDRSIVTGIWPTAIETAYVNGQMWLYDASTNTVYTNAPRPSFTLTAGPRPGTYTLHIVSGSSGQSLTVTTNQAAALRKGVDVWAYDGKGLVVVPRPTTGPQILSGFRSQALALLRSPTAKVTRNVSIDGQNAVEVASADGASAYYLNPSTYAPIQMTDRIGPGNDMGDPGNDSTVTLKFTDWQYLTGAAADRNLLSLIAQHPHATVDDGAADWNAAANRLFR